MSLDEKGQEYRDALSSLFISKLTEALDVFGWSLLIPKNEGDDDGPVPFMVIGPAPLLNHVETAIDLPQDQWEKLVREIAEKSHAQAVERLNDIEDSEEKVGQD